MKIKTLIASLGIVAFSSGVTIAAEEKDALEPGDAMPKTDVEMKNVDGDMVTLADVRGNKGTLVIFACNHCPFVKAWQDRIVKIGNTYSKKGVGVILINSNDPKKYKTDDFAHMKKRAKQQGYKFPYVVDATSDVARAFTASRTPEVFLFNAEDELVYHGAIDDNPHHPDQVEKRYLRNALDALLAGEEIENNETRSVGCSIKFR